jgi:hypothetical protein
MKRWLKAISVAAPLLLIGSASANAQGLLDKAKDVAKKTSIGKSVTKLGTEAVMLDATAVSLEDKNIAPVQVGALQLGIASVDIKNGDAVRLHLFLFNPAQTNTAGPLPPPDLFVLVDEKGRRLALQGQLSVKNLTAGSTEITVPAMERVEMSILFNGVAADAKLGTLKVGSTGAITGIPINTGSAGAANGQASSSPWKK